MNIYKVTNPEWSRKGRYDVYDSFVCIASNESMACGMHPEDNIEHEIEYDYDYMKDEWKCRGKHFPSDTWSASPIETEVEYLGKAEGSYTVPKIILASFNAG